MRVRTRWFLTIVLLVVGLTAMPAFAASRQVPKITRIFLTGGYNGVLGMHAIGGVGFGLGVGTTLTLGSTFTETLGLEPYISFSGSTTFAGWSLNASASYGGFGGDYRVNRLPEIVLTHGGRIAHTVLNYGVEAGLGNYVVRPADLTGARATAAVQLYTSPIPLASFMSINANAGYRQNAYGSGVLHSGWWRSVQLTVTPHSALSAAFTVFRQDPTGTSPLLFDGMSLEHNLIGSVSVNASRAVSLQHSQTYSLISQSITARVYGVSLAFQGGQLFSASFDDIPQKLLASYGRPGFGAFTLSWEFPTGRFLLGFSR